MKYEFMAMGRVFLPLYGALLILSGVNTIFGLLDLQTPAVIGIMISVLLIIGILVVTFLLIIQRFWNNLLSSEGYLMMTLPVSTDKIILSKVTVASIWTMASAIVVTLSILIMTVTGIDYAIIAEEIRGLLVLVPLSSNQISIIFAEVLLFTVLSTVSSTMSLYACMAFSMVANKHRWLVAIGSYIGLMTALQTVAAIFAAIGVSIGLFTDMERFLRSFTMFGQVQIIILIVFLVEAVLCALYYFITRFMLKNRLNLQ